MTGAVLPNETLRRNPNSRRKSFAAVSGALYILFSIVALYSIDGSQNWDAWGDDFALYIAHARNLVEGTSYADTRFVYNATNAWYSPRAYPPGFPALLAPVYALRGLDLHKFKAVVTVSLVMSLPLMILLLARTHGRDVGFATAALFALSPLVWGFQRYILPDIPFLLLSIVVLLVLDYRALRSGLAGIGLSAIAGLLIYAASATRVLGLALLIAALGYDLIHRPKSFRRTIILLAAFLCAGGLQRLTLGELALYDTGTRTGLPSVSVSDTAHTSPSSGQGAFGICLTCIPKSLYHGLAGLQHLAPLPHQLNIWLAYGFIFVIVAGIIHRHFRAFQASRVRQSPLRVTHALLSSLSVCDLYCAVYMGILLAIQLTQVRYLVPILPFVFAYGLQGGVALGERLFSRSRTGWAIMLLSGLVAYEVSHGLGNPSTWPFAEPDGRIEIGTAETQGLFTFIREKTPEDSLIVFEKPRALALFTSRRSTLRSGTSRRMENDLEDFLRRGVDYVLATTGEPSPFGDTNPSWFADPNWRQAFELKYSSDHFEFLRFIPDRAREIVAARPPRNGN